VDDAELKAAYIKMLKTLEKIKVALEDGTLMGDPKLLSHGGSSEMAKFVTIINELNLALYKGRQSYDKILDAP
jgi:hypothetical protein